MKVNIANYIHPQVFVRTGVKANLGVESHLKLESRKVCFRPSFDILFLSALTDIARDSSITEMWKRFLLLPPRSVFFFSRSLLISSSIFFISYSDEAMM